MKKVEKIEMNLEDELELLIEDLLVKAGMEQDPAERTRLINDAKTLIETKDARKSEKRRVFFQWVDIAVKVFGVGGPLLLYYILFQNGLQFETTGSVRSKFFGNLIGKIKPTT
jgi:hypothetical protein